MADILANVLVFAEPRPPHEPLTSASPENTGISFSGISILAAVKRN